MMVRLEKMVKLESSDSDRDSQYEEEKMAELESSDSDSDRQYEDYEDYDDVVDEMEAAFARAITSAREMLGEELESYFGTRKLASTGRLRKARRHYVSAHSKHDYLVKLYYTAWERFKQITFALDYAAQLIMSDVKSASSRS
nr:hypothetical protein BaRGS_034285 [Batillaria attramentaria]